MSSTHSSPDEAPDKESLLRDLTAQIKEQEAAIAELHDQIAEKEIEIGNVRRDVTELRNIQTRQSAEGIIPVKCPEFDRTQLNPEHRAYVNDLRDRIDEVELILEKQQTRNTDLSKEYADLVHENEDLKKKVRRLTIEIERAKQKDAHLKEDIESAQRRLKDQESQIRANSQTLTLTETALSGLMDRQRALEENSGGIMSLDKGIVSLKGEISSEEQAIGDTQRKIDDLEAETAAALKEMDQEIKELQSMANWAEEAERIADEIEAAKEELAKARAANEAGNARYKTLYERYRQLVPLVKKWEKTDLSEFEPTEPLDVLLTRAAKAARTTVSESDTTAFQLEEEIVKNSTKEGLIRKRQEELERGIVLFNTETKRLKDRIEARRMKSFEEEHEIVEQISALKIKIAQRQMKK
jgi:chromosome segregation ATPase